MNFHLFDDYSIANEEDDKTESIAPTTMVDPKTIALMREVICYGISYDNYSKLTVEQRLKVTKRIQVDVEKMIENSKDCFVSFETIFWRFIDFLW